MYVKMQQWPNFVEVMLMNTSTFFVFHLLLSAHLLKLVFLRMEFFKLLTMCIMELLWWKWCWVKVDHLACIMISTIVAKLKKFNMNSGQTSTIVVAQKELSMEKPTKIQKCLNQFKISYLLASMPWSNKTKMVIFGPITLNILEHIKLMF